MEPKLNSSLKTLIGALAVMAVLVGTGAGPGRAQTPEAPLLIELFTSQGCSSCPPAEELLNSWGMDLFKAGKALPLAFHVDYWDYLGWKDPFSSRLFTDRQRRYAETLRDSSLYTPQMVVAGRVGFVGSDLSRAKQETAVPAKPLGHLSLDHSLTSKGIIVRTGFTFPPTALVGPSPKLYAVVFENGLSTDVLHGENQGKNLVENFVVRDLKELGTSGKTAAFSGQALILLDPSWVRNRLGLAVFAQDPTTQKILALRWVYPISSK